MRIVVRLLLMDLVVVVEQSYSNLWIGCFCYPKGDVYTQAKDKERAVYGLRQDSPTSFMRIFAL
jgi:hypothetical protein